MSDDQITPLIDPILPHSRPQTDPLGWRLLVGQDSHGQHKWVYLPVGDKRREKWKQDREEKYWLGIDVVSVALDVALTMLCQRPKRDDLTLMEMMILIQQDAPTLPKAKTPLEAARNGFSFYKLLQSSDGHWSGAYGGDCQPFRTVED